MVGQTHKFGTADINNSSLPHIENKNRIIALIPAYNEERFIGSVVLKTHQYIDKVIVVDDGSSDDTAAIAKAAGAIVIQHDKNMGKGAALNSGFKVARELGAMALVLLDGDGQHRPDDIPAMLDPILNNSADMVVGSRYLSLDSDIPAYRRVGQHTITMLTNAASGVSSTDSWSGFRAFSLRSIENIFFNEGGWGVDPEFQFQAKTLSLKVAEVPIIAIYDESAKRNPIPHGLKTLNAIMRMTGQHRPLLFMGGLGLLLITIGIWIGLRVVAIYQASKELAVGMTILSTLLIVVGTVFLSTGVILHSIRALLLDHVLRRGDFS